MSTKSERAEDAKWHQNRGEYVMECPKTGCDYRTPPLPVSKAQQDLDRHTTTHSAPSSKDPA